MLSGVREVRDGPEAVMTALPARHADVWATLSREAGQHSWWR